MPRKPFKFVGFDPFYFLSDKKKGGDRGRGAIFQRRRTGRPKSYKMNDGSYYHERGFGYFSTTTKERVVRLNLSKAKRVK